MYMIRIDFIDKKYTLISTIEIKNALKLMMGGVGGGGGEGGGGGGGRRPHPAGRPSSHSEHQL